MYQLGVFDWCVLHVGSIVLLIYMCDVIDRVECFSEYDKYG